MNTVYRAKKWHYIVICSTSTQSTRTVGAYHGQIDEIPAAFCPHLAVDEGDAVSMAGQLSDRLWSDLPQCPSVPHLAQRVVAARVEQLRRTVGKRHGVHVVFMGIDLTRRDANERCSPDLC